jgi:hypothetical protein
MRRWGEETGQSEIGVPRTEKIEKWKKYAEENQDRRKAKPRILARAQLVAAVGPPRPLAAQRVRRCGAS